MSDKPTYNYETVFGVRQEVELMIHTCMNGNISIGLKGAKLDDGTHHFVILTANVPSAPPLEPFHAAIDIERLGRPDAMNFLSENGLAKHTGEHLRSGYMAFPVFEFDPEKLAEADPKGFKFYLKTVGLDKKQIKENSVEDLASMAKERLLRANALEKPDKPQPEKGKADHER